MSLDVETRAMQGRFTVPLPAMAPRACAVCERPLDRLMAPTPRKGAPGSAPESYPLCRELACRWIFEQVANLPDAEFRRQLQWRAQTWRTARAQIENRTRLRRERAEAEAREAAAVFAALRPRCGRGGPPDLQLVVPSGHAPTRPLPERRRRAHAAHLDAIISAALGTDGPPVPAAPPAPGAEVGAATSGLPGRLCGVCGGGCCAAGGDKAYLSEATIRRVMAADPGLDPARLRALYLGRLAQRTVSGSCVHHTRHGCGLPRSLRSDVCNTYACDTLASLRRGLEADPPVREAVVLRRRQNRWNQLNPALDNDIVGAAILTETAVRRLGPPKPAGWTRDDAEDPASSSG